MIENEYNNGIDRALVEQLNKCYMGVTCDDNLTLVKNGFFCKLKEGYKLGDEQKCIKENFNNWLENFILLFLINYHHVKNGTNITRSQLLSEEEKDKIITDIRKDPIYKKMKCLAHESPVSIFKHTKYKNSFKLFIDGLLKEAITINNWTGYALDYFTYKMYRFFINQGNFEKNDILDMLIIFALNLKDTCLLTLDKDLIKFLSANHKESYDLIQYYYSINLKCYCNLT